MLRVGIIFDKINWGEMPFDKALSNSYRLISAVAKSRMIRVYLSDYRHFRAEKFTKCMAYDGKWIIVRNCPVDIIYDKMSYSPRRVLRRVRLHIQKHIPIVNDPQLNDLTEDKYATYRTFRNVMPRTYLLTPENVRKIRSDHAVIKPRFGEGGKGVEIVKSAACRPKKSFLIQEFVDTTHGIRGIINKPHDLRLVVLNGTIIDVYLRIPRRGLISNVSLGGKEVHIPASKVPQSVLEIFRKIDKKLSKYRFRMYSIDFLIDERQRPWVGELNGHPGLYFVEKKHEGIYLEVYGRLFEELRAFYSNCTRKGL